MKTLASTSQTVLEALVASLEGAAVYNRSAMVAPAAILAAGPAPGAYDPPDPQRGRFDRRET